LANYHGNVNNEIYEKWFGTLLDALDDTGKKYIITIDNARYRNE
jgi:hypothetical protein